MELLLAQIKQDYTWTVVGVANGIIVIAVFLSLLLKDQREDLKILFFSLIVVPVLFATIYLVGSTIYLNWISQTGGPVHWHADFEIWNCGKRVDSLDPEGLSNKIGTSVLHEHNDSKIHIEGVVLTHDDVSLGHFFSVIGGLLDNNYLSVPTNDGKLELKSGQKCGNEVAELQVFVYHVEDNTYFQNKLRNPSSYTPSPYAQVPPGDCIIIELDKPKDKTDRMCLQYQVQEKLGEIYRGGSRTR